MGGIFDDGIDPLEMAMLLAISEELSGEEKMLADHESEPSDEFEDDDDRQDQEDSIPERDDDIF